MPFPDLCLLVPFFPHKDSLDACSFALNKTSSSNDLLVDSILKLIELVLENNHFQFNSENYMQKMGTATGSPMAPAYASLFMGKLELEFLERRDILPSVWLRFLYDIFMV